MAISLGIYPIFRQTHVDSKPPDISLGTWSEIDIPHGRAGEGPPWDPETHDSGDKKKTTSHCERGIPKFITCSWGW